MNEFVVKLQHLHYIKPYSSYILTHDRYKNLYYQSANQTDNLSHLLTERKSLQFLDIFPSLEMFTSYSKFLLI